jgi:cytosine permease
VGIPEHIPGLPASLLKADNPASLYSFLVGFIIYLILAKGGMRPPVVGAGSDAPQQVLI